MLSEDKMREIHRRTGASKLQILEAQRYLKGNRYDHLQPGDREFDRVFGEKRKKQEDRLEKAKKDAEDKVKEMQLFEKRKRGMDKVHKKFTIL